MKRGPGRPKKVLAKQLLELRFTCEELLHFKSILFEYGLTAHQFIGYILQQVSVHDQRIIELLTEATEYKKQRIMEGKEEDVDATTLFRLIEEANKKLQK